MKKTLVPLLCVAFLLVFVAKADALTISISSPTNTTYTSHYPDTSASMSSSGNMWSSKDGGAWYYECGGCIGYWNNGLLHYWANGPHTYTVLGNSSGDVNSKTVWFTVNDAATTSTTSTTSTSTSTTSIPTTSTTSIPTTSTTSTAPTTSTTSTARTTISTSTISTTTTTTIPTECDPCGLNNLQGNTIPNYIFRGECLMLNLIWCHTTLFMLIVLALLALTIMAYVRFLGGSK